jgi:Protein of unknown function (DUF2384)
MAAKKMQATPVSVNVADRVSRMVEGALKREHLVKSGTASVSARVAGAAVAMIVSLTEDAQRKLDTRQDEFIGGIRGLLESFSIDTKIALEPPPLIEKRKGAGLGKVLAEEEGRQALGAYGVGKRLEDWAGPVAGATELNREYGIPRSSLNRWQHSGDVIGLLKGMQKHAYPIDQFLDGRPARGIAEVNALASNPRVAWLWLNRGNPTLSGRRPIDLLKEDRVEDVVAAARAYFEQP